MSEQARSDVRRHRLRVTLRNARKAADLTQREVAEEFGWSLSKIIRIEGGRVGVSKNDTKALLTLYGQDNSELVNQLVQDGQASRKQRWSQFRDILAPEFARFLGYEGVARSHRHFEPMVMPGLLQTKEFAEAMARKFTAPETSKEDIERYVSVNMLRQEVLENEDMKFHFIVDESVIRRWVATEPDSDPEIMRDQLARLKQLGRQPHIKIQVVPFTHGLHSGLRGPFVLLQVDDHESVLFQEKEKGSSITKDNTEQIRKFDGVFRDLESVASEPGELGTIISAALKQMRRKPSRTRRP